MRTGICGLTICLVAATAAVPQEKRAQFEVASVKPNTSGNGWVAIHPPVGGRFTATNARLKMLAGLAYKMTNFQISGGPGWADSEGFDIEAKASDSKLTIEEMRPMLQSLLEDRFQLKVRRETKEVPVYALTLPKGTSKLPEAREGGCTDIPADKPLPPPGPGQSLPMVCGGFIVEPNHIQGGRVSMTQLSNTLANILGRPVMDKTGFTGTFDVKLEFSPEGTTFRPAPDADNALPTIFTALQDQFGLKLESQKGPQEMLVIEHAEKPTEN